MTDLTIRKERHAGRITLTRPQALNALNHAMVLAIEAALDEWRTDAEVRLVIIDAEGERAFCAGGDVAAVCRAAQAGDHLASRRFFADEYRMNARIARFPRPVVSFMQGFVMGGGVGVGGHADLRIVGASTRIAMPETGIGLIPDVGGSWLLARAPGRAGEYLGLTGARMGPGDAIFAGFADRFVPESDWPDIIAALAGTGDADRIPHHPAPPAPLEAMDLALYGRDLAAIEAGAAGEAAQALAAASPLSKRATLALVRASRADRRIEQSLSREYRFTHRATEHGDFVEGVRARLIDKDGSPRWTADSGADAVGAMLAPLGPAELAWPEAEAEA